MTGRKESTTYSKEGHGDGEVGDGEVGNGDRDGNGADEGFNVDVMGGELTSLGVPPLLSEPHDQPYSTQPYATKLSQFHSFTNPNAIPYKFPTVGTRDSAMGRECHVRATL